MVGLRSEQLNVFVVFVIFIIVIKYLYFSIRTIVIYVSEENPFLNRT